MARVAGADKIGADRRSFGRRGAKRAVAVEGAIGRARRLRPAFSAPLDSAGPARRGRRSGAACRRTGRTTAGSTRSCRRSRGRARSGLATRAAVTRGVPSASRAQVLSERPGSGSASTWRDTVTSSGAARRRTGSPCRRRDMLGRLPRQRAAERAAARLSAVGVRSSSRAQAACRRSAAAPPPDSTKAASLSCARQAARSCRRAPTPTAFSRAALRSYRRRLLPPRDFRRRAERALDVIAGDSSGWRRRAAAGKDRDARRRERSSTSQVAPAEIHWRRQSGRSGAQLDRQSISRRSRGPGRKSNGASPMERPCASSARTTPERRPSDGPRRCACSAPARLSPPRGRSPSSAEHDDSLWPGAASASARAKAAAPPSSIPSGIQTIRLRVGGEEMGDRRQNRQPLR